MKLRTLTISFLILAVVIAAMPLFAAKDGMVLPVVGRSEIGVPPEGYPVPTVPNFIGNRAVLQSNTLASTTAVTSIATIITASGRTVPCIVRISSTGLLKEGITSQSAAQMQLNAHQIGTGSEMVYFVTTSTANIGWVADSTNGAATISAILP